MSHTHLNAEERMAIEIFLSQGLSCHQIGARLNRCHTSISREIIRNGSQSGYRGPTAQRCAELRRKQPRHYQRQEHEHLVAYVEKKLRSDWSPQQIANRIRLDHPDDARMRISTEALYSWIYTAARHGGTMHRHLRRGRSRRRPQKLYGKGKRFFPRRVGIAKRPPFVESRERFGDWEADLMSGSFGKAALATCIERKSRFLIAAKVEDKTTASFNAAITAGMLVIPEVLRTWTTVRRWPI